MTARDPRREATLRLAVARRTELAGWLWEAETLLLAMPPGPRKERAEVMFKDKHDEYLILCLIEETPPPLPGIARLVVPPAAAGEEGEG